MPTESRTRVSFFLPVNGYPESRAVLSIIRYLKSQATNKYGVTGFTHSALSDPIFFGEWWAQPAWIRDRVVLFMVDYSQDERLEGALIRLRRAVFRRYAAIGSPQQEVWIIAQQAIRHL